MIDHHKDKSQTHTCMMNIGDDGSVRVFRPSILFIHELFVLDPFFLPGRTERNTLSNASLPEGEVGTCVRKNPFFRGGRKGIPHLIR